MNFKLYTICFTFQVIFIIFLLDTAGPGAAKKRSNYHYHKRMKTTRTAGNSYTRTLCLQLQNTLRARHKSCFLRPDTGPCRADIIQWYFDVKQKECYRFFWGGCQGNGNRFETKEECHDYCHLNTTFLPVKIPDFCQLSFDYGSCFGYFNRWTWDHYAKTCKLRIYSGCGGNQNNFETQKECSATCLTAPNSTLNRSFAYTTCIPYNIVDML